jgi:predicted nucleic acid-binding Zn ribbon protein
MPDKQPGEDEASDQPHNDPIQNDPIAHDPTGLELAQTMARSLGAQARRRRRSFSPKRVGPQMSGARADDRDPKPLSDAVERLVETKGWTTEINVHTLLARWALLVGATNAAHSQPEGYADNVLMVRADSTAWATQLRYLAPQLVAMLNEQLGDGTVIRIKVLGPDAPSWKRGLRSVRDGRGPRDTYG